MGSIIGLGRAAALGLALALLFAPGLAKAQMPPEAAEINACLCLQQAVATLSAEMNARNQALDAANRQFADLDAQVKSERPAVNVNDPNAVARFKGLLERRDAAYHQSIGQVHAVAVQAVGRYNARVNEYNSRCANRPFNSAIVAQVQAHLTCPPLQ